MAEWLWQTKTFYGIGLSLDAAKDLEIVTQAFTYT